MSLNNIAVDGCTLEFQNGGSPNTAISINPNQMSSKVKADGKAVYKTLKFTISGYTGQDITVTGSGSGDGEIITTAEHTKVEGNFVLLEGDESATIKITGLKPSGSSTTTAYAYEVVKITSAGQNKVKGA